MEDKRFILDQIPLMLERGEVVEYFDEPRMGMYFKIRITPLLEDHYVVECSVSGFKTLILKGTCHSIPRAIAIADELECSLCNILNKTGWKND